MFSLDYVFMPLCNLLLSNIIITVGKKWKRQGYTFLSFLEIPYSIVAVDLLKSWIFNYCVIYKIQFFISFDASNFQLLVKATRCFVNFQLLIYFHRVFGSKRLSSSCSCLAVVMQLHVTNQFTLAGKSSITFPTYEGS